MTFLLLVSLICAMSFGQSGFDSKAVSKKAADALAANPNLPFNPYTVIVKFRSGVSESYKSALRTQVGGGKMGSISSIPGLEIVATQIDPEVAVARFLAMPGVEHAELDYTVRTQLTPNDPSYGSLWGMHNTGQTGGVADADIDAPEAWDIFTGNPNTVIAIIDTGIQRTHPDLAANMWTNPNEIAGNGIDDDNNGRIDDLYGWDFVNNDNDPSDDNGHGTHCAGTIGGVGNNGAGVVGVNWSVKMVALKFLGSNGSGSTSSAMLALDYCVRTGIKISSNSWGGSSYSPVFDSMLSTARDAGHLFIAAAGNASSNNDSTPTYPASYGQDNVIAVASIDSNGNRSGFSNYGAVSVDIGAPGGGIQSTYPTNSYATMSGTSMATPHVAGAAALIWGFKPSWTYAQVRDCILNNITATSQMSGVVSTGGVLNVHSSLLDAQGSNTAPTVAISAPANGSSANFGASVTFTGSASDTQDGSLTSSLVWTSNRDGQIGTGGTFAKSNLSAGVHTITANVTDSGGLNGSAVVTLTINAENTPPTVQIQAPSGGSSHTQGTAVTFTGSANDTQDGSLSSALVWTSSVSGQIGTGASFSTSTLAAGSHTITARATDSGGLQGSATVTITIQNTAPTVQILSPASGSSFTQGVSVSFSGSANDVQNGNLTSALVWTSSVSGQIGTGGSFSTAGLSVGTHTITARATDSGGLQGSATITLNITEANAAPVVQILSPANGSSFTQGVSVSFSGSANDPQSGNLSSALVWTSSMNGQFGTGASVSTSALSVGTHTITARATDSGGLQGSASISLTINAPNTPPVVQILSPGSASSFNQGSAVSFSGSSNDAQSGNLSAGLVWTSSISGQIGTGASFSTSALSVGSHLITAQSTDPGGLVGSATITLNIQSVGVKPNAPSSLRLSKMSTTSVRLTWRDNSNNEAGFTIERQQKLSSGYGPITTLSAGANTTSYVDGPGRGTFRFRIRAFNGAGVSAWTGWSSVRL